MTRDVRPQPPASGDNAMASDAATGLARHVTAELAALMARPVPPGLHLVATPIGNLADVTLRALTAIAGADRLYCEDTRHTTKLLARYGIRRRLDAYHEHNADRERPHILRHLDEGRSVALVSDAGTPLVSDPGYKLVRDAVAAGHPVTALPGPSATLAALTISGLPTDAFHFAGFLAAREGQRKARIAELAEVPATLVLFEAPSRLAATLADLAAGLGPRHAVVARELTKLHEEAWRGTLQSLAAEFATTEVKGEIVIVIGPAAPTKIDDEAIRAALETALTDASVRDAATAVADALGVARSRVYGLAVSMKRERDAHNDGHVD